MINHRSHQLPTLSPIVKHRFREPHILPTIKAYFPAIKPLTTKNDQVVAVSRAGLRKPKMNGRMPVAPCHSQSEISEAKIPQKNGPEL